MCTRARDQHVSERRQLEHNGENSFASMLRGGLGVCVCNAESLRTVSGGLIQEEEDGPELDTVLRRDLAQIQETLYSNKTGSAPAGPLRRLCRTKTNIQLCNYYLSNGNCQLQPKL